MSVSCETVSAGLCDVGCSVPTSRQIRERLATGKMTKNVDILWLDHVRDHLNLRVGLQLCQEHGPHY